MLERVGSVTSKILEMFTVTNIRMIENTIHRPAAAWHVRPPYTNTTP